MAMVSSFFVLLTLTATGHCCMPSQTLLPASAAATEGDAGIFNESFSLKSCFPGSNGV